MVTIVAGDGITLVTDEDKSVAGSAAAIGDPGDTLSYGISRAAGHGTVAGDAATGAFTYTPTADFFGNDSFDVMVVDGHGGSDTLRVEVSVAPVNDAPHPASATPFTARGNEEAAITGAVAMTDPENNTPLRYALGDPAQNGRVNIDQNGNYTYTGNKDFFGEDHFTVVVTDSLGAATEVPVTVTVDNVQDAPHFIVGTSAQVAVTKNIAATRSFFAVDPDGEALTYHVGAVHPAHGDLGIDPRTGAFTYTPEEDYLGADQFTLEAHDASGGVATLTVNVGVKPVATLEREIQSHLVGIGPDNNSAMFQQSFIYDNFIVDIYSTRANPSSGTFQLPVTDYVFGVLAGNLRAPDGSDSYSESFHGYAGMDFSDPAKNLDLTMGGRGFGADRNGVGSTVSTGSNSIFNVTDTGSWRADLTSASPKPPVLPIEAFDQHPFPSFLTGHYPGETLEQLYAGYLADYSDIFVDTSFSISNAGNVAFEALRGDVFTQSPALQAFLDQFWSTSIRPDATTTQLAANAPGTTTYSYTYTHTTDIGGNPQGGPQLSYVAITDRNLPLIVVTPVGGTFEDSDGDGDFDFHGDIEISFRGSDQIVLRLTGADVQMDLSVLHVTGATVYAAISEGAGLVDPLFKASFDLDRKSGTVLSFAAEAPPEGSANPFYAPGGLALTYSNFSFNPESVQAFAKMAMPVPIFDSLNLDLATLTGVADQGGLTFEADHYGLAGGSASLGGIEGNFFGLFDIAADDIVLTYDNVTDTFSIDGEIKIKSPILDLIPGAKEPELTFSDLKLHDGKFSFDGELAIDELKLPGGFGLSDITLSLTLDDDAVTAFSGETHISLGDGKPEPVFGIGFQRPPLSFDKITLGVDSLGVPLGDGVFLEKIQGTLENLADTPPETAPGLPTQFTGTLGFGWGPEIAAFELPEFLGGAEVGGGRIANLEVTGTMDFANTFNETITLNFLSDNLIKTTGVATLDLAQNMFSGLLSYDVLDGIATGQMLTVSNGHGITAHGNQTLTIPSLADWGPLSGAQSLSAEAFLSISTDVPSQSFFAAWTTLNMPIVGALTVGFKIDAGSGFHLLLGGNDIPKTHSFDVDGTEDWLLITASWQNETPGHVLTQVRTPENTFIQEADYAANGITLVADLTTPFKTAIVIDDPRAGNWDLQVIEPGVGTVQYHGISPNPAEQFAFAPIVSAPGDIAVSLGGLLDGAPEGSTVSFFYDSDGTGFDGSIIGTDTIGPDGAVALTWNLAGTPRGDYHIYAVAFDGMNAPTMVYADDSVHVALAPTDITVGGVAVSAQSPDIDVSEGVAVGAVVGTLGVIDPDFGTGATFTLLDDAGGRFALVGDKLVVTSRAFLDADIAPTRQSESGPIVAPPPIHTITVQATDADGLSITRDIQINVTDVLGDIDYIMYSEDNDSVSGYDANSPTVLLGRGGDDTLSGGNSQEDIAVFEGFRRSYAFTPGTPADTIRDLRPDSPDGTDTAYGVEIYRFADGDFSAAELGAAPNVTLRIVELDPIAENAAAGTLVAEATVENPLPGEAYTFTLADDAGGLFRLEGNQVLLNGALDFETASFYTLKIQATDTSGFVYEESVFVDVSDVDENGPNAGDATGAPLIVGTIVQGQTLTVDVSFVSDPDGIALIGFQWKRSTDGGATFTDATGFFSLDPSYTVQGADVGAQLLVLVAVQDVKGNLSAVESGLTAPVTTTTNNHEPTGAPLIDGATAAGFTLMADTSGIADADGLPTSFTFSWVRVKGALETSVGSGETYTLTGDDIGAHIKLVVRYVDGGGIAERIESALSNPVTLLPGDDFSRLEFNFAGGAIQENLFGVPVGTVLFDGLSNPSLTYTITDPSGAFEMVGNVLKLKDGVGLDFEAGATRAITVSVFDGGSPVYVDTMTVAVLNQPATLHNAAHEAIPDSTVFNDVLGLIGLAGPDGLTPHQWVNERAETGQFFWEAGPIEVEFARSRNSFLSFRNEFRQEFNDTQKDIAFNIFALVSSFAGVDFVETSFSVQPHIKIAIGTLSQGIFGIANGVGSDEVLVGSVITGQTEPLLGGVFYWTLMHELGHTLGLDHGHNNAGTDSGFGDQLPHLPLAHDRSAYSVMTYNTIDGAPQSYMMADIATLQYLYGADFTANSGDTVYSWSETTGETFIDGVSMGATFANSILMTVWDGGGNDTYDASNYADGVAIDLRPGEFSTLSVAQLGEPGALGNVGNAYLYYGDTRSLIENAIGGDGDDTLMGNAGNNRLTGQGGADDIDGGDGTDTVAFSGARASYAVTRLGNGDIQIADLRAGTPDGADVIRQVEQFAFLDHTFSEATLFSGLPPVVSGPVSFGSVLEDSGARLITQAELLAQASDPDSASLTAVNLAIAAGLGTLIDNHDGSWSFTPAADDDTAVSFSYSVTDGVNAVAAAAALDILPVDDTPVVPVPPISTPTPPATRNDFGGDGHSDTLWQNADGTPAIWTMDGTSLISGTDVGFNPGADWRVIGSGDFDGNGKADILWQNKDGTIAEWFMNGTNLVSGASVAFNPGPAWHAMGTGDFNADGKSDILWQNQDGTPAVWLMDGVNILSGADVGFNPGAAWQVIGAGDFDGDSKSDILWQNQDGTPAVWLMNGTSFISGANVGSNPGAAWHAKGTGDFNGDGKADILWQNADGTPAVWLMDGFNVLSGANVGFNPGPDWHAVNTGDFNADGKSDILWQNTDGTPAVWLMDGTSLISGASIGFNPGNAWHVVPQHQELFV